MLWFKLFDWDLLSQSFKNKNSRHNTGYREQQAGN